MEPGSNITLPEKYRDIILPILQSYPEIADLKITFRLVDKFSVPYGTMPAPASLFKSPPEREYIITILEEAEEPLRSALFRNLPPNGKTAVIAHELCHVIQFNRLSSLQLMMTVILYSTLPAMKKKLERGADEGAILHGYGQELYEHAVFIRSIPDYVKERPEIDKHYLYLDEIIKRLKVS
jgi:hypothetical protein